MRENNLANNLFYLREAFGDTISGLAEAVAVSKSTIHKYENQVECKQRPEILKRIAIRYGITVDELCYGDFSCLQGVKINGAPIENLDKMKEISLMFYPILKPSAKAFEDPFFVKGYEAQNKIRSYFYGDGTEFNRELLEICINSFSESIEKNHTLEASANLLWLFTFFSASVRNKNLCQGLYKFYSQKIDRKFFQKEYAYKSFDKVANNRYEQYTLGDVNFNEIKEMKFLEEVFEIDEENYATLFFNLKRNYRGCEYADYYMALRYVQDLIENDFDEATNAMLGIELMSTFETMDNQYAIKFFEALQNYFSIE